MIQFARGLAYFRVSCRIGGGTQREKVMKRILAAVVVGLLAGCGGGGGGGGSAMIPTGVDLKLTLRSLRN